MGVVTILNHAFETVSLAVGTHFSTVIGGKPAVDITRANAYTLTLDKSIGSGGATAAVQIELGNANWVDVATTTTISGGENGTVMVTSEVPGNSIRAKVVITGSVTTIAVKLAKREVTGV